MKYTLSPQDIIRCREISHANRDLIKDIAREISKRTGVSLTAIYSTERAKNVTAARHLVMYLARRSGITYEQIGNALARDHSTVIEAVKKERERRGEDAEKE
jgi:chromosomal replication initiation ATPase DnaA